MGGGGAVGEHDRRGHGCGRAWLREGHGAGSAKVGPLVEIDRLAGVAMSEMVEPAPCGSRATRIHRSGNDGFRHYEVHRQ
jgi:hypothetical protein